MAALPEISNFCLSFGSVGRPATSHVHNPSLSWSKVFVLCLILVTFVFFVSATSAPSEEEKAAKNLGWEYDDDDFDSVRLQRRSLENTSNRLDYLSPWYDFMANLSEVSWDTYVYGDLVYVYDVVGNATTSLMPVDDEEAERTAAFLHNTATTVLNTYFYRGNRQQYPHRVISLYDNEVFLGCMYFDVIGVDFKGVYISDNTEADSKFKVGTMCIINNHTAMAHVFFPNNTSPLRPPPSDGVRVGAFRVIHLILMRDDDLPTNTTEPCKAGFFFRMITFTSSELLSKPNMHYGCAQWDEQRRDWTDEHCIVVKDLVITNNAQCNCDTSLNGETTEYIFYEYTEDVDEAILLSNVTLGVDHTSDIIEMKSVADRLSKTASIGLETLINDILFRVMQFDSSLLANNCSTTILEDIARVMVAVDPGKELGVIGFNNRLLKGVVFDLDTYKRKPVKAYAFYNATTYAVGMENVRSTKTVDYNRWSHKQMEFSFEFSESVVSSNTRYGFILYALNKFFKPVTKVNGVRVLASRVLDVFLVPKEEETNKDDQLVHIFFTPDQQSTFHYGCAFWSASLGDWTTEGCFPNPDLYTGACTCNLRAHFAESRTRFTIASLKFPYDIDVYEDLLIDPGHFVMITIALFCLGNLDKYYQNEFTGTISLDILTSFNDEILLKGLRLGPETEIDLIERCRKGLIGGIAANEDVVRYHNSDCMHFHATAKSLEFPNLDFQHDISCTGDFRLDGWSTLNFTFPGLSVNVSASVKLHNERYALLSYPLNYLNKELPTVNGTIVRSYSFDVMLRPGNASDDSVEQFVLAIVRQFQFNASLGCSYWREDLKKWTSDVCRIVLVDDEEVCNCTLKPDLTESVTHSHFIAYAAVAAVFDKDRYKELASIPFGMGNVSDVDHARELLYNMTQIPFENVMIFKVLKIYLSILSLDKTVLLQREEEIRLALLDVDLLISKFEVDPFKKVTKKLVIRGNSKNLKSADVSGDLFSNAVLSASNLSTTSKTSDMVVTVLGRYQAFYKGSQGFYLAGDASEQHALLNFDIQDEVLLPNCSLVCFISIQECLERNLFVFAVLPINLSPYSLNMTNGTIFNAREIDTYQTFEPYFLPHSGRGIYNQSVYIKFQPTAELKYYVKTACAIWNITRRQWSPDLCPLQTIETRSNTTFEACHCNLTGQFANRIMLYEYTEKENFSFHTQFEGAKIVFLITSLFSVFGLGVLVMTAVLFKKWRDELGNKIMINLTAATFLYLVLTMYRETHLIYAVNDFNVGMIVFTASVHYSRLVHHCWGLVMSVLQYKRFSGVVGATTVSHLLLKVSIFGWGLPLAPVGVLLAWDQNVHFCTPDKLTHYVLYLVPVVVITVLNIGLLVAIVLTITNGCGLLNDDELQRHGVDNKEVMLRRLKQTVLMFFLFGIPALFEMVNDFGGHSIALEYINKILDPIQGFVMFLFFVVIDDKTKGYWHVKFYGEKAVVQTNNVKKVPIKLKIPKARAARARKPVAVEDNPKEEIEMKDIPTEEMRVEEIQGEEKQSEENKTEENKTEDMQVKEIKTEEMRMEEIQGEEEQTKEIQVEEIQVEEKETKEIQIEEIKVEEKETKEIQIEETQVEEEETNKIPTQ